MPPHLAAVERIEHRLRGEGSGLDYTLGSAAICHVSDRVDHGVLFDIDGERGPEPSGQVQFLTIPAQPSNDDLGHAGLSRRDDRGQTTLTSAEDQNRVSDLCARAANHPIEPGGQRIKRTQSCGLRCSGIGMSTLPGSRWRYSANPPHNPEPMALERYP